MGNDFIIHISNQAIKTSMLIAAPMLVGSLLIGILVSIFQAVTQINEQTLSFIPKILVIIGAMVLFGPWMIEVMQNFTVEIYSSVPSFISYK